MSLPIIFIEDEVFEHHILHQDKPSQVFNRLRRVIQYHGFCAYVSSNIYGKLHEYYEQRTSPLATWSFKNLFQRTTRARGQSDADIIVVINLKNPKVTNHQHKIKHLSVFLSAWDASFTADSDIDSKISFTIHRSTSYLVSQPFFWLIAALWLLHTNKFPSDREIRLLAQLGGNSIGYMNSSLRRAAEEVYVASINMKNQLWEEGSSFFSEEIGINLNDKISSYLHSFSKIQHHLFDTKFDITSVLSDSSLAYPSGINTSIFSTSSVESKILEFPETDFKTLTLLTETLFKKSPSPPTSEPETGLAQAPTLLTSIPQRPLAETSTTPTPKLKRPLTEASPSPTSESETGLAQAPSLLTSISQRPLAETSTTPTPKLEKHPTEASSPPTSEPETGLAQAPSLLTPEAEEPFTETSTTPASETFFINTSGGKKPIRISDYLGNFIIHEFGGIGRGVNPSSRVLEELDILIFEGDHFSVDNIFLNQDGEDLLIGFYGLNKFSLTLKGFNLDKLDNIPFESQIIGNIVFGNEEEITDSFDVINRESKTETVFNKNKLTILNNLDNVTHGLEQSDDIIHSQGGDDFLIGKSGDDSLHGGNGNDWLQGDAGRNKLYGGSGADAFVLNMDVELDIIMDFTSEDYIVLPQGLIPSDINFSYGVSSSFDDQYSTYLMVPSSDLIIAELNEFKLNSLESLKILKHSQAQYLY